MQALLFQIFAFFIVFLFAFGLAAVLGVALNIVMLACLQGIFAAGFSYWRGLAFWWWAIQLFFPLLLVLALSLQLPPLLFLFSFLFFLLLYWSSFRTQVPFYPSGALTWSAVAKLLPQDRGVRFIDIGSGLGGLVLNLSQQRPDSRFVGIELAPLPWLVSAARAYLSRSSARFKRGNYEHVNFSEYEVVFAYLSPVAMSALWEKAQAEMRPGTLLLSYAFPIPDVLPAFTVSPSAKGAQIYGWRF